MNKGDHHEIDSQFPAAKFKQRQDVQVHETIEAEFAKGRDFRGHGHVVDWPFRAAARAAAARMLVFPGPPKIFCRKPPEGAGDHANPTRGAKLSYLVGASVLGIPLSPGNSQPVGASGKIVDCWPALNA